VVVLGDRHHPSPHSTAGIPIGSNLTLTNITTTMVIVIKRGMTKKQIDMQLAKLRAGRGMRKKRSIPDIRQFVGTIKLKEDPLVIQKRTRDEWR